MDLEQFIEDIKKKPELYNKQNKNYMNCNEKEKIWKELDKTYQIEAKKKWNSIRDKYVREKKKLEAASGSGAKESCMWELFPLLTFLDDSIKPRRMKENIDCESSTSFIVVDDNSESWTFEADNQAACSSVISLEPDTQDSVLFPSSTGSSTPVARKRGRETEDHLNKAFLQTLSVFSEKLKDTEDDEDSLFLKCIEKKMKKMSEEEKSQFKIDLLIRATEAVKNSHDV